MDFSAPEWIDSLSPGMAVALIGAVTATIGTALRDSFGASTAVSAAGIALLVAGVTYAASVGSERARLGLTALALVAVQLVGFGGVVRWVGVAGAGVVLVVVVHGRLRS